MAKPTRIKHSAAGIYFNDVQIDRGTSFGCSSALNTEELKEIGNAGIVEIIDGIPTVDITIDSNEYGSVKTTAALANKFFPYGWTQAAPHAVSGQWVTVCSGQYFLDERRFTLASANDVSFVTEIAALTAGQRQIWVLSINSGGTVTKTSGAATTGVPSAPSTPANSVKIAEIYLKSGLATVTDDYILNIADQLSISITDFEYAKVDIVVPVKETGDNTTTDTITRSMYVENAFCNRIDMSFNTGGVSTNTFGLESDNKRWFLGSKKTIKVDRFDRSAGGTYSLTDTPIQLDNSYYTLRCRVYNPTGTAITSGTHVIPAYGYAWDYVEGTAYTVSGTTVTFTDNPPAGTRVVFRYCGTATSTESFLRLPLAETSYPDPPGGLMQGQIEIFLTDDLSNHILRVESCTISATLTREALNQLGDKLPYDRPLTLPVPVTVTINTTASDLQEFARLAAKGTEFTAGTLNELSIEDFSKDLSLRVKMYREPDTKRNEVPFTWQPTLKEIEIDDLAVTDEGFDIRLDTNATQTFSLRADNLTIKGRV